MSDLLSTVLAASLLLLGCGAESGSSTAPAADVPTADAPANADDGVPSSTSTGDVESVGAAQNDAEAWLAAGGYVIWESSRGGAWRLWTASLDGSAPRQLTPDEPGRAHCCGHIAPDGSRLVYLSLPRGQERYPDSGAAGAMHVIRSDGSGDRVVVPEARTYFEHRAAVWRDDRSLIYIDARGRTALLDLTSDESRLLTTRELPAHGWLIDATLRHASSGGPTFSAYDADARAIREEANLGGCQPYFSHDGRWGFWIAGAGGPLRRFDLATRQFSNILGKSDPRMPADRSYLYFPMLSRDGTLLALGASEGEHDHQRANYDIFVAATDPDTLELIGRPWRVTDHPATDRFPDVHAPPLALGRHFGEAPLEVAFEALPGADWRWDFGDGETASGGSVRHVYETAGTFSVSARRAGQELHGFVRIRPAAPPEVVSVEVLGQGRVVIRFDDAIDASKTRLRFPSGRVLRGWRAGADAQSLELELAGELSSLDTLFIEGLQDRASPPNRMPRTGVEIAPPGWPSDRQGLVMLWETGASPNLVALGPHRHRTCRFEPQGRAWLDRHRAMVLAGGSFLADQDTMEGLLAGCQATNELTIEMWLTPRETPEHLARIFTFSWSESGRNFTVGQRGERLIFRLRTPASGKNADNPEIELGRLRQDLAHHVVIAYTPGRLAYYLDGEEQLVTNALQEGFFHWRKSPLLAGNEWESERPWLGTLEGVAVYNRALEAGEARLNFERYAARVASRPPVAELRLRARLTGRSKIPTLDEITPYRDALAVFEYQVEEVLAGEYSLKTIRVVERVLVDGEVLEVADRTQDRVYELSLEPFADHPQLESLFLSETLSERYDLDLYFELH